MPTFSYNDLYTSWQRFIQGALQVKGVRKEILASWKRCQAAGVDPYQRSKTVDGAFFSRVQAQNRELLDIVSPFVDLLDGLIRYTGFIVVLVNSQGVIIQQKGDTQALEKARSNNLVEGAERSELVVGTNAISLVLTEKKPFQIFGPEHYNQNHHEWTCAAAPVCYPNGETACVLNLSGHHSLVHKHTLGMVISAAQAIEREFCIRANNTNLTLANERLKAVIDSISEGVVAVDKHGVVQESNAKFRKLFMLDKNTLHGRKFSDFIKPSGHFTGLLAKGQEYFDQEEHLNSRALNVPALTTGRKIVNENAAMDGAVVIVKEAKDVYHLVNRLTGSKAMFTFADIICEDPNMKETVQVAQTVARSEAKVLLEGESGTGKELFAQAVHNASSRSKGPFVAVNCSAIPRELMESELFGYSEGAFTGAKKGGKPGKFELAEGGTLFLDEINSTPLDMQIKLLRVLQQNELTRVGGEQVVPVNVRVISASNEPLGELVKAERFRLDLYYRLGVVVIHIPPLRERPRDIPILFRHLFEKICASAGRQLDYSMAQLTPKLCAYSWPGNVRELENCIERGVILAGDDTLSEAFIPAHPAKGPGELAASYQGTSYLDAKEREAIEDVLKQCRGNISRSAATLGISRNTLYSRIRLYGLEKNG